MKSRINDEKSDRLHENSWNKQKWRIQKRRKRWFDDDLKTSRGIEMSIGGNKLLKDWCF